MYSCGALPKFLEDKKLFQFLSGLNEAYSTAKSNILMQSPFPKVIKAYSMLQHDEHQRENSTHSPSVSSDSMSFSIAFGPYNPSRSYTQRVNFDPNKTSSTVS